MYMSIHVGFKVATTILHLVAFLIGATATGIGRQSTRNNMHAYMQISHAGSAGVSFIFVSQTTPSYLNCTILGRVGGSNFFVVVPYFLTLAGSILGTLAINIAFIYCCLKCAACCCLCAALYFLSTVAGVVGWVIYGSMYLRDVFSQWTDDRSQCSLLLMILSVVVMAVTAIYAAIYVTVFLVGTTCGCYFKCCGKDDDDDDHHHY